MSSDRIHLSVAQARALGEGALGGIGYNAEEARIIADHVIDAALCGYEYSGLAKILNIPEHRRFQEARRPMRIVNETAVSALYDGGNNVGMVAMYHAANAAIAKAAAHGISIIGVTNSWMSGRSAYYVEMIANAGLVAIHTAASSRLVAPPGGVKAELGTNPIAIAVPSSRGPIVLDIGTSAYMMTEVMLREETPGSRLRASRTRSRRGDLASASGTSGEAGHPALVGALRAWRSEVARKRSVPAYVVLHDATIDGIAASRPMTLHQLRDIPGIGDKKLEHYGDELIALVKANRTA